MPWWPFGSFIRDPRPNADARGGRKRNKARAKQSRASRKANR